MKKQEKNPSDVLSEFLDFLESCQKEYERAKEDVANEDAKKQDFLHAIEFERNCKERSKISTKLHISRCRRRDGKDRMMRLEKIVSFAGSEKNKPFLRTMRGLIKEQVKTEQYLDGERIYKPRGSDCNGYTGGLQGKSTSNRENT